VRVVAQLVQRRHVGVQEQPHHLDDALRDDVNPLAISSTSGGRPNSPVSLVMASEIFACRLLAQRGRLTRPVSRKW
jgi:hypothetical protein